MTDTPTDSLKLRKQAKGTNADSWGGFIANNWDRIDEKFSKVVTKAHNDSPSITLTSTDYTADDATSMKIVITGSLTTDTRQVIFPNIGGSWIVENSTNRPLSLRTSGSGRFVILPSTKTAKIYCDGSNNIEVESDFFNEVNISNGNVRASTLTLNSDNNTILNVGGSLGAGTTDPKAPVHIEVGPSVGRSLILEGTGNANFHMHDNNTNPDTGVHAIATNKGLGIFKYDNQDVEEAAPYDIANTTLFIDGNKNVFFHKQAKGGAGVEILKPTDDATRGAQMIIRGSTANEVVIINGDSRNNQPTSEATLSNDSSRPYFRNRGQMEIHRYVNDTTHSSDPDVAEHVTEQRFIDFYINGHLIGSIVGRLFNFTNEGRLEFLGTRDL